MTMKTIKVAKATERQLNWLVARIEGDELPKSGGKGLEYSTDWACGGPILERMFAQGLRLHAAEHMTGIHDKAVVAASLDSPNGFWFGPTALIAATRCFVASKLGSEVEVPEELACSPTPKND